MVATLLAAGADPDLQDAYGNTALLLATRGDPEVVRALIEGRARPDIANRHGQTALMEAARHDIDSVELLLEAGAEVSHRDLDGIGALTVAKAAGKTDIVARLRLAGASESLEEQLDLAIREGDREAVGRLIAAGVDVNARDLDTFQTPLMTALEHRRLQILSSLLEAGADPTLEATGLFNDKENAITRAAEQASPWALRELIQAGARQQDIDRALLAGCADPNVLRVVLEAGVDVNVRGADGETALVCAARKGATDAVSALLAAGARTSGAALKAAQTRGHEEVVALLKRAATR